MIKPIASSLLALAVSASLAMPAFASDDSEVLLVESHNSAHVSNVVIVGAHSGGNVANGGFGGVGGDGGSIRGEVDDHNAAGNGGNGGAGGKGGIITAGEANASSHINNNVNDSSVDVDPCACTVGSDTDFDHVEHHVHVKNEAWVSNEVAAAADSGDNVGNAGDGGAGGMGGSVGDASADPGDYNTGGNGGNAGAGGMGGDVLSNNANATSDIVSVVNHSVVRVRH